MSVLAILGVGLRRLSRDRTALFFVIVLPIAVILIVGATVRGLSTFPVGVVDEGAGPAGATLVAALERAPDLDVHPYPSVAAATTAVARSEVSTAVVLPAHMDAALRAGRTVAVGVMAEPTNSTQQAAAQAVESVVERVGARVQAALFATARGSGSFAGNLARAATLQRQVPAVQVRPVQVVAQAQTLPQGYSYSAPTMLVLFVFLNAVVGGATIIETRQLGVYERMATTPVRTLAIVGGETATLLAVALAQAGLIVLVGAVVFGVSWGDPAAATALVAVWALVGAGAGTLSGTAFRTPEQATAIGPAVGIALAMLGGCMWPLSIVSSAMREVGHATPQAWAVDAWTALLARHGTLATIVPDLAVLAAFAAGLLALATARLRRILTSPSGVPG